MLFLNQRILSSGYILPPHRYDLIVLLLFWFHADRSTRLTRTAAPSPWAQRIASILNWGFIIQLLEQRQSITWCLFILFILCLCISLFCFRWWKHKCSIILLRESVLLRFPGPFDNFFLLASLFTFWRWFLREFFLYICLPSWGFVFSSVEDCICLQRSCFIPIIRSIKINFFWRCLLLFRVVPRTWPWRWSLFLVILPFWIRVDLSLRCLFATPILKCFIYFLIPLHAVTWLIYAFILCRTACSRTWLLLVSRLTILVNLLMNLDEFFSSCNIANRETHEITHLTDDASSLGYFSAEFLTLQGHLVKLMV